MEAYRRYVGLVSMNPVDISRLPITSQPEVVTDTVFLMQVATGPIISLYKYTDAVFTSATHYHSNRG
ncbi:hypothetical protein [Pontibacter oryzae]|nr:hypothetical protein [Pontibacter oryzae]